MRRPGLWVANGRPPDTKLMYSWRPAAITCFYDYLQYNDVFNYKALHPTTPVIVRFQHPLNWHQNPTASAQQFGRMIAGQWAHLRPLDPYIYFANELNLHYENGDPDPANQPLYTTPEFYQKCSQWIRMTAEVIKSITPEMKLITPPFAFGHNEDGSPNQEGQPLKGWAGYDYLYETVRDYFDNILTFHSYWGHAGGSVREWLYDPQISSWYAFRWRRVLKLFAARYRINARLIIDEAGNFAASDPDFTDQIIYHARQCLSDARVIALTYFLWFDPTNSPGNLPNSWAQRVLNLSDHLARLKNMPEVPLTPMEEEPEETGPTIRLLLDDGSVEVMGLEQYLRAVVPAEMPALWSAEAVKAQAIASRSYAHYHIRHPRHPNADICANPAHCQNYDPARVHPRSDAAIQATAGIVARYGPDTINALFSANCGGHTLDNEAVFDGAPVPYLRGVSCPDKGQKRGHGVGFCQYGARALAEQGYTYDQIIRHYYTDVHLAKLSTSPSLVVEGILYDHLNRPVPDRDVQLTGTGVNLVDATDGAGVFLFANLPHQTYTLTVEDISQIITPAPGEDKISLTLQLSPPPGQWRVKLEEGEGLPLLVGDIGLAGQPITITTPTGRQIQVMSGSKPEWGTGGFEIYATVPGNYIIRFLDQSFTIPLDGDFTRVIFRKTTAKPEEQVRLVSASMPRSRAETLLRTALETDPQTQGLFQIQTP